MSVLIIIYIYFSQMQESGHPGCQFHLEVFQPTHAIHTLTHKYRRDTATQFP